MGVECGYTLRVPLNHFLNKVASTALCTHELKILFISCSIDPTSMKKLALHFHESLKVCQHGDELWHTQKEQIAK